VSVNPSIWIVILNFNRLQDTLACLSTVRQAVFPNITTLVLNFPPDSSWSAAIQAAHPQACIFSLSANRGYAGNNNVGIREALAGGADWVLILNEDILMDRLCVNSLVEVAQGNPNAGLIGPKVYQADAPSEIQAAGGIVNQLFDVRWRGEGETDRGQYDEIAEVDVVHGCAIMLRRELIEAIGAFDERFFMYREEVDLCLRARRAGYKVLYAPQAQVWHRRPAPPADRQALTTYYMTRNAYLLLSNHHASSNMRVRTTTRHLTWLLNWTLNPKWRHKHADRNALFKALIDALLSNYGYQSDRYGT